jgi:hypothetical protein
MNPFMPGALVRLRFPLQILSFTLLLTIAPFSQSPNGTISGLIVDPASRVIVGAGIVVVNDSTGLHYETDSNSDGIYLVSNLPPGSYRIQVSKIGFKTLIKPEITLNVQGAIAVNFTLPLGAVSETLTVEAGVPLVDTESAAVSTVVDRQFAENLPLNGRSFQTLIQLTPGVVLTPSNQEDAGQFSVNGQRTSSNYWMVDGVSANIGIGLNSGNFGGNGLAGGLGSFSALGGTNSLVSVDAMQEFRIQTSTYAPEFGRTPGAQISIVTRSGTNRFHGTVFDYLRNDALDANNWFNGYVNSPPLPKARERQNDFGGTLSGPIRKDRTFFFFSYEGLRLRLPETTLTTVPDLDAREGAISAMQPYLNAYPQPNGADDPLAGIARFNASYSNPASLDANSLRLDHRLTERLTVFGRYNDSPSEIVGRGSTSGPLSTLNRKRIKTQTATAGGTLLLSSAVTNDIRFNYSRTDASSFSFQDDFGGAVPLASLPFPAQYDASNGTLTFNILQLQNGVNVVGQQGRELQRQLNIVDGFSALIGSHTLKVGGDFRRLSPLYRPYSYRQFVDLVDVPSAESGDLLLSATYSNSSPVPLFRNLGLYAQDTWRVLPRLTLTYGLRWDTDFVPGSLAGPSLPAVVGSGPTNLSDIALAPAGTAAYATHYNNIAPRLGASYQLVQNANWQTVLRGGGGVFYDLASSAVGNTIGIAAYPFGSIAINFGGTFPLSSSQAAAPPILPPSAGHPVELLLALDPHMKLPYTLEWNGAVEQGLGREQTVSISYLGSAGRRLIQTELAFHPNPDFNEVEFVTNAATSDYQALQVQFNRRLLHGVQALASYTWSHSLDTASAGSVFNNSNNLVPDNPDQNRADSDFDIRHAFSVGLTYEVTGFTAGTVGRHLLHGWSLDSVIQARTAPPVEIVDANFFQFSNGVGADIRPDRVPDQPLYLYSSQYPGGKAINLAAFEDPPVQADGNPARQGDVKRNALRGFGAVQWDCAVHREIPIHDSIVLQFRAEMFNLLNHPSFGQPNGQFGTGGFGLSSELLGQYLSAGNVGGGAFSPLYQVGGPRSIQFALKLHF